METGMELSMRMTDEGIFFCICGRSLTGREIIISKPLYSVSNDIKMKKGANFMSESRVFRRPGGGTAKLPLFSGSFTASLKESLLLQLSFQSYSEKKFYLDVFLLL